MDQLIDVSQRAGGGMTTDIQRDGAIARALGKTEADNPYFKAENLPKVTGETPEQWSAKANAWDRGWKLGDALIEEGWSGRC